MSFDKFAPISQDIDQNHLWISRELGIGSSFDVGVRDITIQGVKVYLYYVTGLCDSAYIIELLKQLVTLNDDENVDLKNADNIVYNRIVHQQVSRVDNLYDLKVNVLSGLIAIIIEGESHAYIVDVRNYPGRGPAEPDTEKTVRGSRDGFTENIVQNTALVRRRIRDGRLRMEILRVGNDSRTDVCLSYIEGVADDKLVKDIRTRINNIDVRELVMSDKKLEELITKQYFNPFPLVRFTERPDVVSVHLYQGYVAIIVDTSPSVIIAPATFFDHLQHVEEYRQVPLVGTIARVSRFLAIFGSLFIIPIWLLLVLQPDLLPPQLHFIGPREQGNIPIYIQIILGEAGMEFLRMAAIHTPSPLSTAMGLVAGILVGQIAIDVGWLSPEVVLYVAFSAIGTYSTPSYELSLANKLFKIIIVLATAFFKLYGFIFSTLFYFIVLIFTKSFGKPYFYPVIPFNFKKLVGVILRLDIRKPKNKKNNINNET